MFAGAKVLHFFRTFGPLPPYDEIDKSIFFENNVRCTCAFAFFVVPLQSQTCAEGCLHIIGEGSRHMKGVY